MNESEDLLKSLRLMYREKLQTKINDIESQFDNLHNMTWNDEKCKDFYKMVHQFNGSSGSYGYPEISEVVAKLETYIKPFIGMVDSISTEQEKEIKEKIQDIKYAVELVLASDSNQP